MKIAGKLILLTDKQRTMTKTLLSQWKNNYTPKAYAVFVRNHFSGITPANQKSRTDWDEILQRDVGHVARSATRFWRLRRTGAKWRRKTAFSELFVSKTAHRLSHSPSDDFREIWTQNMNRCGHKFFRNRIFKFFQRGHLPRKTLFSVFLGTLTARGLQPWALGVQQTEYCILLLKGQECLHPEWLFSCDLPLSRYRGAKSPLILAIICILTVWCFHVVDLETHFSI